MSPNLNKHFFAVVTFDPQSLTLAHRRYEVKPLSTAPEDEKFHLENTGHAGFIFAAASQAEAQALTDTILPNPDHVGGVTILSNEMVAARLKEQAALTL